MPDLASMNEEQLNALRVWGNIHPKTKPEYMSPLDRTDSLWDDHSVMKKVTCVNHPWVIFYTKNPWNRSLILIQGMYGLDSFSDSECTCSFDDLRLIVSDKREEI